MVWGSFLIAIAAAALKTPTRNGYIAQGVNLTFLRWRTFGPGPLENGIRQPVERGGFVKDSSNGGAS